MLLWDGNLEDGDNVSLDMLNEIPTQINDNADDIDDIESTYTNSTDCSGITEGCCYDTDDDVLYCWDGDSVKEAGSGVSGLEDVEGIPIIESGTPSAADVTDIANLLQTTCVMEDYDFERYFSFNFGWDDVDARYEFTSTGNGGFGFRNDEDGLQILVPTTAGTEDDPVTFYIWLFGRDGTLYIGSEAIATENYVDEEPRIIQTSLATTTNSDDNKILFFSPGAITLTHVAVACEGTCTTPATITLEDGSSNAITPASAIEDGTVTENAALSYIAISSGGTLVDGEIVRINTIADANPETDTYWFSFKYTVSH
jgi:hypothetical protein